jgi:hypothetical protein
MTNSKLTLLSGAAFIAAGAELNRSRLPILKLTKDGKWVAGADNTPVSETRFAADVAGVQRGYMRFVNGTVEEMMRPVALAKISRDELPNDTAYEDEERWREAVSLQLRSIKTGEELLYKATSQGGLAAVGALMSAYGHRLRTGDQGIAVVDLVSRRYVHKRYGPLFKPSFPIVDWLDEGDPSTSPMIPSGGSPAPAAEKPDEGLLSDQIPF